MWNVVAKDPCPVSTRISGVECCDQAVTVAERSKAWTVFARSNTGIVGSNRP
jgi:hypothetical protein